MEKSKMMKIRKVDIISLKCGMNIVLPKNNNLLIIITILNFTHNLFFFLFFIISDIIRCHFRHGFNIYFNRKFVLFTNNHVETACVLIKFVIMASNDASQSAGIRVHTFSDKLLDTQTFFQVLTFDNGLFLWVGTSQTRFGDLSLAMKTKFVSDIHLYHTCQHSRD